MNIELQNVIIFLIWKWVILAQAFCINREVSQRALVYNPDPPSLTIFVINIYV